MIFMTFHNIWDVILPIDWYVPRWLKPPTMYLYLGSCFLRSARWTWMWISAMTNRVVLLFPCPRVVRTGTICFDCWVELLAVFNQSVQSLKFGWFRLKSLSQLLQMFCWKLDHTKLETCWWSAGYSFNGLMSSEHRFICEEQVFCCTYQHVHHFPD